MMRSLTNIEKQIKRLQPHFKLILAVLLGGLLSGCVRVIRPNEPISSKVPDYHYSKDIVITFPAWISEEDKFSELEKTARLKAAQKCKGAPYKLIDIKSDPYHFNFSLSGGKLSVISANISCTGLESQNEVQAKYDQQKNELIAARKHEQELEDQLNVKQSDTLKATLGDRIHLIESGGTFTVPVRLNGQFSLNFTIDSGAADVSIPVDVVITLIRTGTIRNRDFIGEKAYVLADGSQIKSKTFMLHELQVGNRTLHNVQASLADVNASPLLGQSFLKRFKSWSIDNATHELVLQ